MRKWVEISTKCDRERYGVLSEVLREAGFANEVAFIEATPEEFPDVLERAKAEFDQIKIGRELCLLAPELAAQKPSTLLTLRSADCLVNDGQRWWPRNVFVDGVQRTLAIDLPNLDLLGGVFILGATAEARSFVAALTRVGFHKFSLSDPDEARGEALVEELRSIYFRIQFQFVPRHMITQLPAVHSFAVNTLAQSEGEGVIEELFYFNFLKSGGVWLDLPLVGFNKALEAEAASVGALVEPSYKLISRIDQVWVETCWNLNIESETHFARLARISQRSSISDS